MYSVPEEAQAVRETTTKETQDERLKFTSHYNRRHHDETQSRLDICVVIENVTEIAFSITHTNMVVLFKKSRVSTRICAVIHSISRTRACL